MFCLYLLLSTLFWSCFSTALSSWEGIQTIQTSYTEVFNEFSFRTLAQYFKNWISETPFSAICDTQKDGATRCILGRSTCRPKIYCVCMGIWRQTISLENKFWAIYEQQSQGTRQTIVLRWFGSNRTYNRFSFKLCLLVVYIKGT